MNGKRWRPNLEKVFASGGIRSLIRLTMTNRRLRKPFRHFVERKIYKALVEENVDGRPAQVQRDKYALAVALLESAGRAIDRGLVSPHVLQRLLDTLLNNVVFNANVHEARERLGFPPPLFLTVSPGMKCNLHCTGCYACSDSASAAKLDFQTFDRILTEKEELWGSHFTVISGGEPFLWKDAGHDLLDMVARHPSQFFLVFTNGTFITEAVAQRMEELGNITPAISVEGFEQETDQRRGTGVYRRILQAFENLRQAGVPFGISATATKDNWRLVTSDEFADFYFEEQGSSYGWIFQYMPIGRRHTLELMVSPEDRLEMFERTWHIVRDRKFFLADFWNSGTASNGCVAAGHPHGGYFYINWDGDVTPCVFIPFRIGNINDVYRSGGDLNTILLSPFPTLIRHWQNRYGYARRGNKTGNWLAPCIIRDHFDELLPILEACWAEPIDTEAEAALADPEYRSGLIRYGQEYRRLSGKVWQCRYLSECTPSLSTGGIASSSSLGQQEPEGTQDSCATAVAKEARRRKRTGLVAGALKKVKQL